MGRAISILQFGTTGQLARALIAAADADVRSFNLRTVSRAEADFRYPENVASVLRTEGPFDCVINAVAYTAVDRAESDEATARLVNAISVEKIAQACENLETPLIHFSTDYVFDGTKLGPYDELDEPAPLNAYGRTKLYGEKTIRDALRQHVILRTSWVYSAGGSNFVRTMLKLGLERDVLHVIDDQYGAPTSALDLATATLKIVRSIVEHPDGEHFGTFHLSGRGVTTWFEFANAIFEDASTWKRKRPRIEPISMADYLSATKRPRNSQLNCGKIDLRFALSRPHWRDALRNVLTEIEISNSEEGNPS